MHHQPETETSVATDEEEVNVSIETNDKPKTKRKGKRHLNDTPDLLRVYSTSLHAALIMYTPSGLSCKMRLRLS
ncbi:hypothetical protein PGT21_030423 [Puccinia graminis f. sp. tritici]|uniref:Uncharacterized protein n=1 Tax=Puccinia graminis f. sp. tritici TaxID=56615 RepID=A0A5B0PEQ2_PUCGR|nr:hypothetical protein PGT21_030423 [Puccinia graminis f. sp. tritici]KAA1099232.1 hypothetical protein PGTUg99_023679 [Puccinia graminis f. sp. tritici]